MMDDNDAEALRALITLGKLREHRAIVRSARARQTATLCAAACQRHEMAMTRQEQACRRASDDQLCHLKAGRPSMALQAFIDAAPGRIQREQHALGVARARRAEALAVARDAAKAVVAAQERTRACSDLLVPWQRAQQARREDAGSR